VLALNAPFHDGGKDVTSYCVDYSTQPFVQEKAEDIIDLLSKTSNSVHDNISN
jgi:hypothetical protein